MIVTQFNCSLTASHKLSYVFKNICLHTKKKMYTILKYYLTYHRSYNNHIYDMIGKDCIIYKVIKGLLNCVACRLFLFVLEYPTKNPQKKLVDSHKHEIF